MEMRKPFLHGGLLLGLILALLLPGCGPQPRTAVGIMDTPEHHTRRGHDFIEKGEWIKAREAFDKAISLGKDYGPAYAGKAIEVAHRATPSGLKPAQRKKLFEQADDLVDQALEHAKTPDQKRAGHVAGIQIHQLTKVERKWLNEARNHYDKAVKLDKRQVDADPHLFMARAYRDAFQLRQAEELYRKVLAMNNHRSGQADQELAFVQRVIRAAPGTPHGRAVAFAATISRADLAALLISELQLARIYLKGKPKRFDNSFKAPSGDRRNVEGSMASGREVVDIATHPLRADIVEVIKLRVSGLQPDPQHRFLPNKPVLRFEFAMIVQDILVKVTGDESLPRRFIGEASKFSDVRNDHFSFNAIQTVTSRGLMEPTDKINGVFGPRQPIQGADALLVIRLLQDHLRRYVR